MKCPYCAHLESKVVDSRPAEEGSSIRRRRECLACHKRFTTYETMESLPLVVIKKDGSRQAFDKSKLLSSMLKACEKRSVSVATLERMTDEIEQSLQNEMEREVSSAEIGELAMEKLKNVDDVSYVRFASVYRQFKDIGTFMDELNKLLKEKEGEKWPGFMPGHFCVQSRFFRVGSSASSSRSSSVMSLALAAAYSAGWRSCPSRARTS